MSQQWIDLIALADNARLVQYSYRKDVEKLQRARDSLEIARRHHEDREPWPQSVESALHNYTSCSNIVDDFWSALRAVADAAPLLLPDLASDLVHVRLASDRWHDQRDFPWEAGLAELRRVEDSARRAAAKLKDDEASGDDDDESAPPPAWQAEFTPQEWGIISALWGGSTKSFDALRATVWKDDDVQDPSITQALKRLNPKLESKRFFIVHKRKVATLTSTKIVQK